MKRAAAIAVVLGGPPFLDDSQIAMVEGWILTGLSEGDASAVVAAAPRLRPKPGEAVTFADVEPIFLTACVKCHSDNSKLGAPPEGLRLSSYELILLGGERIVVVPGNVEASERWRKVTGDTDITVRGNAAAPPLGEANTWPTARRSRRFFWGSSKD